MMMMIDHSSHFRILISRLFCIIFSLGNCHDWLTICCMPISASEILRANCWCRNCCCIHLMPSPAVHGWGFWARIRIVSDGDGDCDCEPKAPKSRMARTVCSVCQFARLPGCRLCVCLSVCLPTTACQWTILPVFYSVRCYWDFSAPLCLPACLPLHSLLDSAAPPGPGSGSGSVIVVILGSGNGGGIIIVFHFNRRSQEKKAKNKSINKKNERSFQSLTDAAPRKISLLST